MKELLMMESATRNEVQGDPTQTPAAMRIETGEMKGDAKNN